MSELSPKAVFATMQQDAKQGPLARTLLIARIITIAVAVGGAIPTAIRLYQSWSTGIPMGEISHRLAQVAMWERNFDCKVEYRALTTALGSRIDAGACEKTRDIAIKVTAPTGKAIYEWIAFDKLSKSGQPAAALWPALVTSALAGEPGKPAAAGAVLAQATPPPASGQPAGMRVLCQVMPAKGQLTRVVQEGAKCYREQVSLFRGSLERRDEVACTTTCK